MLWLFRGLLCFHTNFKIFCSRTAKNAISNLIGISALVYLFIYFWLHCVFVAACRLSLDAVNGGYSSLLCTAFSLQWLLLLWSTTSKRVGFTGLVAPRRVGSSRTRAQIRVLCIGRQILNHCATREVPALVLNVCFLTQT